MMLASSISQSIAGATVSELLQDLLLFFLLLPTLLLQVVIAAFAISQSLKRWYRGRRIFYGDKILARVKQRRNDC
jgi:hypothetical protein